MKKRIVRIAFVALAFLFVTAGDILAQCAMCRASVETNVNEDGIGFAAKLNTGILYLFVMPYLLAMIIGYLWFKKSQEQKKKLEEAALRRQRFING